MNIEKKKLLFVITKSVWGGAQRYIFDLATHLPTNLYDIAVIAGGSGLLLTKLSEKNIRYIPLSKSRRDIHLLHDIAIFFILIKLFTKEKPDIVHLNSSKIGGVGAVAAKTYGFFVRKKINIIFTAHGWAWNEDRSYWQKKIIQYVSRIASWAEDSIIILSHFDFDAALRVGISPKKLFYIPNAIPDEQSFLAPLDAEHALTEKTHINLSRPLIGVIAELTKNKGILYLIQALLILKKSGYRFTCLIIGTGEQKNIIEEMIAKNALGKFIFLTGFLENASEYLKALDIMVLPSLKEGLPYVLLEAQKAGIPTISTDVGGIPDIIEHMKNGILVSPKNTGELAEALETIIRSKILRIQFAKQAEEKSQNFSFIHMLSETQKIYGKHT